MKIIALFCLSTCGVLFTADIDKLTQAMQNIHTSDELTHLQNELQNTIKRPFIVQNNVGKYEDNRVIIYNCKNKYVGFDKNDLSYFEYSLPAYGRNTTVMKKMYSGMHTSFLIDENGQIEKCFPTGEWLIDGIKIQYETFVSMHNRDMNPHFIMVNK
jgi:hypothetical protein